MSRFQDLKSITPRGRDMSRFQDLKSVTPRGRDMSRFIRYQVSGIRLILLSEVYMAFNLSQRLVLTLIILPIVVFECQLRTRPIALCMSIKGASP